MSSTALNSPKVIYKAIHEVMRINGCLELRVKGFDLARGELTLRQDKGDKDRRTMFSRKLYPAFKTQIEAVKLYANDD